MHPPIAPTRPHVHLEHGVRRDDPWHWLKQRDDPEVLAYIEAENAWTAHRMARLEPLVQALFDEMRGALQETDQTAPVFRRGFWYYTRTVEGLAHPIHCRRKGSLEAPEQVVLDVNRVAEGHGYTQVGEVVISPDQRWLAYSVDHTGRELFDVVVVDLESGEVVDRALVETGGDLTWATDGRTLLYSQLDEALRPWRIARHRVGSPPDQDAVLLTETDPKFRLSCRRTRSDAFLVIDSRSSLSSEVHLVPADAPHQPPRCVQPRVEGMRYGLAHWRDRFFVITNRDEAVNFKVMQAPVDRPEMANWTEWIPYRPEVQILSVDAFADHLVLLERENGLPHLRIRELHTGEEHRVPMESNAYDLDLEQNPNLETTELRYTYTSMLTPPTVYAYAMDTGERRLLKRTEVLGGYDPGAYRTERFTARAPDGAEVPISIVYPADHPRDGTGHLLLYGYGSYGITIDAAFAHHRLPLLSRGVAFAIAHVRGGGLLGRPWYEAGKLEHKHHTFDDFIACAEHLQREGWTRPDRTAIVGGSAGGMLIGAVINRRPELFRCAVAAVPFVDVVSTMLDESLPLTANEWEEWGDPREPEPFRWMLDYSPYDNVADHPDFPALLIVSGLNDPRVQYWEPTKWCAKLRATLSEPPEILLKTHTGAGHQGQSGRYGRMRDMAFEYAWILGQLGLAEGA